MRATTVLVVDDNADLLTEIVDFLQLYGFDTLKAQSVESTLTTIESNHVDVVVLDLGLPDGDGLMALQRIRARHRLDIGVVITTARGQLDQRLCGHDLGADAYLIKPVDLDELRAVIVNVARRVAALARRGDGRTWSIDLIRQRLTCPDGVSVPLTGAELQLLGVLLGSPGGPVSRTSLCRRIATTPDADGTRRLDSLVSRLRSKVARYSTVALPIRSFRNQGYAFTGPIAADQAR